MIFIIKYSREVFFISLLFYIVSGILPYINVSAIALIISEAKKIVTMNMRISDSNIVTGIAALAISIFFERFLMVGQVPLSSVVSYRVKTQINILTTTKASSMSYSDIENTSFQKKLEEVRQFSNTLPTLLENTLNILKCIIIIVTLLLKFKGQYYIVLIIAIGVIPSYIISLNARKKQHDLQVDLVQEQRVQEYYKSVLANSAYIKEKNIFGLKDLFTSRWKNTANGINTKLLKLEKSSSCHKLAGEILGVVCYLLVIILLFRSSKNDQSIFLSLCTAILSLQGAFTNLISRFIEVKGQMLDVKVVYDFLDLDDEEQNEKINLSTQIKNISFEHVSFAYNDEKKVLEDVSVELNAGETVAIIGDNGAGKSTFIKLLLGIYKPNSGNVLCNGVSVHQLNQHDYFSRISAIFQQFNKYPFSVHQNINIFAEEGEMPTVQVQKVAEESSISQWIKSLPQKYHTLLTNLRPNGLEISGGQWQKLAIARGLYRETDLLIMDEPTSSLDPLVETDMFDKFLIEKKNSIKLIVSHRVGIATKVDKILVFDEGKLVEIGNHKELIERNGVYAKIYHAQAKWYTS